MALSAKPRDEALVGRAQAAYLGLAIGDALGASVEFMTPREIALRHGTHRDICGGGWLKLRSGQVTDDTTMALALGEAIVADHGAVLPLSCARAFDAWMRRKPVDIGNTVRRNLVAFRHSGKPCAAPSEHDAGNGAAMRVLPVALAGVDLSDEALCAAARAQAHVTHNNPDSDAACELIALIVRDGVRGASLREIVRRRIEPAIARTPAFAFRRRRRENPSAWIVETMQAVLQAFVEGDGVEACLVDVVNRGGDADTTGAITGMLAGALYGLPSIPARWRRALDPEVRRLCTEQADALVHQNATS